MKIRTLLLLIIVVAIAAFIALNWSALMMQTTLSLAFTTVQAPLGLVMLGLLILLAALSLVFVIYLQTSFLLEARHQSRELQASRELANQAESSRFTELREFLDVELKKQADLNAQSRDAVLAKLEQFDIDLRSTIEQSENVLSAYMDELEDRLEKKNV